MATKIAFAGHRSLTMADVFPGLDILLKEYGDSQIWITGGAMGLDSWAAKFAMDHSIELWLILPFPSKVLAAKWPMSSLFRKILDDSWSYASKVSVVSPRFVMSAYQERNVRMVDLSDILAAFFNGSPGGTANCIRYARSIGHPVEMFL